jgi:hypothetical protein
VKGGNNDANDTGTNTAALKLIEECVQLRTRVLGINHPDTLSSSAALSRGQAE